MLHVQESSETNNRHQDGLDRECNRVKRLSEPDCLLQPTFRMEVIQNDSSAKVKPVMTLKHVI